MDIIKIIVFLVTIFLAVYNYHNNTKLSMFTCGVLSYSAFIQLLFFAGIFK